MLSGGSAAFVTLARNGRHCFLACPGRKPLPSLCAHLPWHLQEYCLLLAEKGTELKWCELPKCLRGICADVQGTSPGPWREAAGTESTSVAVRSSNGGKSAAAERGEELGCSGKAAAGARPAGLDKAPPFAPGSAGKEGKRSFASLCTDLLHHSLFSSVLSKIIWKKKKIKKKKSKYYHKTHFLLLSVCFLFMRGCSKQRSLQVWATGSAAAAGGGQARQTQTCLLEDRPHAGRKVQGTASFLGRREQELVTGDSGQLQVAVFHHRPVSQRKERCSPCCPSSQGVSDAASDSPCAFLYEVINFHLSDPKLLLGGVNCSVSEKRTRRCVCGQTVRGEGCVQMCALLIITVFSYSSAGKGFSCPFACYLADSQTCDLLPPCPLLPANK